jgi:general secretion pathway protein G
MAREKNKRKRKSGFTLIEIMVVVMIIGMLSALVGVRVFSIWEKSKRKGSVAQMKNFETALSAYRLDNGHYPTTEQGLDALIKQPTIEPVPRNYPHGGYLGASEVPMDPWGNPYVYFSPGLNGEDFSIISYGADGVEGGEGDNKDVDSSNLDKEAR